MAFNRRSFLVGAGTIITASFVKEVATAVADTRSPWLIKPPEAAKAIYYEAVEDHWRLHLGEPTFAIPKPQLLIENLRWHGHLLDTQDQIDALCDDDGWTEEELFRPMDGYSWESQWEHNLSPEAQAFAFLEKHDIFPKGGRGRREGEVLFESFSNPMSCARWVEVHDPLSVSLLQARLNELRLNTEVRAYA